MPFLPLASASSTGSTKHALSWPERTTGVHERRRVRLEATLRHQGVELLRRLLHRRHRSPRTSDPPRRPPSPRARKDPQAVRPASHSRSSPSSAFRARCAHWRERNGTRRRVDGKGHVDGTPTAKRFWRGARRGGARRELRWAAGLLALLGRLCDLRCVTIRVTIPSRDRLAPRAVAMTGLRLRAVNLAMIVFPRQ